MLDWLWAKGSGVDVDVGAGAGAGVGVSESLLGRPNKPAGVLIEGRCGGEIKKDGREARGAGERAGQQRWKRDDRGSRKANAEQSWLSRVKLASEACRFSAQPVMQYVAYQHVAQAERWFLIIFSNINRKSIH